MGMFASIQGTVPVACIATGFIQIFADLYRNAHTPTPPNLGYGADAAKLKSMLEHFVGQNVIHGICLV